MHMSKKKRGRPPHNRPVIDQGTKELQQKRALLLERSEEAPPALVESLLGIFYGRRLISKPLYEAGVCFGELGYRYEPCLGQNFRQYSSTLIYRGIEGYGDSPSLWSDECHEKRTMAWRKALLALKKSGREPYKMVMHVVFYDQDLYLTPLSNRMINSVQSLRMGLKFLDAYFKGEFLSRRDKPRALALNSGRATIFQPALKESPPDFLA